MPWVQGNSATGVGTSLQVGLLSNAGAGNFIFVGINTGSGGTADAASDGVNTYNLDAPFVSTADNGAKPYSALNVAAGATTVTVTGAGSQSRGVAVGEWSQVATSSAFDKSSSGTGFGTGLLSGNTATTTQADELVIGFGAGGNDVGGPYTVDILNSFTERLDFEGANRPTYIEDKIVSATGSYSAGAGGTSSSNWVMYVLTYKLQLAVVEQVGYRHRLDDGGESGAGWKAAQNTSITDPATEMRTRFLIDTTGDAGSISPQLEWSEEDLANWDKV